MAIDIKAWTYTDDLGNTYSRGVAAYVAAQNGGNGFAKIGGVAVSSLAAEPFNKSIKPRTVACIDPVSGRRRRVVIMNATNSELWTGAVTTIALDDGAGASTTYSVYSRTGERRRTRAPGL